MNMKNSKYVKDHFKNGKVEFVNCDAPPLELDVALPIIQEVYDAMTGKGLCLYHCFTILHVVGKELESKLDKIPL